LSVAVLISWRGGDPDRERALGWVVDQYRDKFPDWELQICETPAGLWSKGAAVNPAVTQTNAEIVVVADADVWCDGLERAVYAVVCGWAWAMPHLRVHRLSAEGSVAYMAGEACWEGMEPARPPYEGVWGGGIVVGRRDVFLDAPLDQRFVLWGQEDTCWAIALDCLHGTGWRGEADLTHLWHPPRERLTRQKGSREGWELYRRYRRARRKGPSAMRALIEETAKEEPWALTA
jgi:hypothetical protein